MKAEIQYRLTHTVRERSDLQYYDTKNTPRYYPYGSPENAGQAHLRLHAATKSAGINLQGGNDISSKELMDLYRKAYSDSGLEGIRGDLRTQNGKVVIAENVTPQEAYAELEKWGAEQRKKQKKCSST